MRKIKIFITILALYEFVMLTILQISNYCVWFFNAGFCADSFKYFLMCIAVPGLLILLAWWRKEISFMFTKKCECENQTLSKKSIERFIMALIAMEIRKFISSRVKGKTQSSQTK